jgi:hypothetical protein
LQNLLYGGLKHHRQTGTWPKKGTIQMLKSASALLTLLAAAAAAALLATAADAQPPRGRIIGYVTADSFYGVKTITGPVRVGPKGRLEVGLPGGTWIECRMTCANTLRQETIDFWQNRDYRHGADGPGYFHRQF